MPRQTREGKWWPGGGLGRVDASDPESVLDTRTGENRPDHELSLLDTNTESDHSTITLGLCHGGGTTDGDTDCGFPIMETGKVTHCGFDDGVADEEAILDSEGFEEIGEGGLNKHRGEDDICDRPDTVGGKSGLVFWHEETTTLDEGRLTVFCDQDLIVRLDGVKECGESFRELATHESALRTLSGEDEAHLRERRVDLNHLRLGVRAGPAAKERCGVARA